jgi:hypothetical protein
MKSARTGITLDFFESIATKRQITDIDGYVEDDRLSARKGCFGNFHVPYYVVGLKTGDKRLRRPLPGNDKLRGTS